jgi:hypothetical protein
MTQQFSITYLADTATANSRQNTNNVHYMKLATYLVDNGMKSHFRRAGVHAVSDLQRNRCGILITVALALASLLTQAAQAGSLTFDASVPKPPAELPVLGLTSQAAPVNLMNRLIAPIAANSSSSKLSRLNDTSLLQKNKVKLPEEVVGVVENDHVKAWANLRTGDAEIYPTLTTTKPISPLAASSLALRSHEIFNSPEFIAPDDTKIVIDKGEVLQGETFVRDAGGGYIQKKQRCLTTFMSRRAGLLLACRSRVLVPVPC